MGPEVKRFAALGHEFVPLVDSGNPGDGAALVIEDLVGHMRRYAEAGHA